MAPVLWKIGSFTLQPYGVLLASGFCIALIPRRREARRVTMDPNLVMENRALTPSNVSISFLPFPPVDPGQGPGDYFSPTRI